MMRSGSLVSVMLLAATALAAPTGQHPLIHRQSPYYKGFKDPYDHKIDSFGDKLQPLPIVRTISYASIVAMMAEV